jgi:hypothetical protein
MKNSPSHSVDIAIANAGIGSDNDKLCEIGGESQPLQINFLLFLCSTLRYLETIDTTNPPVKLDLSIIDIN